MKKMSKKILSIICVVILIVLLQINVYALETGNFYFNAINNTNSEPVSELKVAVYKIAEQLENGEFVFSAGFESCDLNINDLTESNIEAFKSYAIQNAELAFEKTTDSNGKFSLENVSLGVYLFVQNSKTEDYKMQTMLVTIPELTEEKGLEYSLTVKPKIVTIEKEIVSNPPIVTDTTLPYTGVLNWPVPVLVILGIIVFCIGWLKFYTSSKKKVN